MERTRSSLVKLIKINKPFITIAEESSPTSRMLPKLAKLLGRFVYI